MITPALTPGRTLVAVLYTPQHVVVIDSRQVESHEICVAIRKPERIKRLTRLLDRLHNYDDIALHLEEYSTIVLAIVLCCDEG